MLKILLLIIFSPVILVFLFVLTMFILSLYYYIKAWLTGTLYAKTVPDPVMLSDASLEFLGVKKEKQ